MSTGKTTIRHLVFDIGQVLIYWDPEIPYRKLIPDADRRKWFLKEVCNQAWNVEQDRGRSWTDAENELIRRFPDETDLIRAYRMHWIEMIPHAIDANVTVMQAKLSQGLDVTLLTNWNQDTFDEASRHYPFMLAGRGVTVSGRVGLIKPDAEIFKLHAKTFDLEPTATLFIDDSATNIKAATEFGWNTIHCQSGLSLESAMAEFHFDPG